jgi:[ribosomal protein S18]-alanine N-acetyltransferase
LKETPLIRALERRDVEPVIAIQRACPEVAQWTPWDYGRVAAGEMAGWVAEQQAKQESKQEPEQEPKIAGFLIARRIATDIEILNLALAIDLRRIGIGSALLQHALAWGRAFQAEHAILEVRLSNLAALHFYEGHGFEVIARRPKYYAAPVEDALVLRALLASPR